MLERLKNSLVNLLQPEEETAGDAMANFSHEKSCPVFGKSIFEQADCLQIGQEKRFVSMGGAWGISFGGFSIVTYIRCNGCKAEKIFQER